MCRRVQCKDCGKPTYAGCGKHVDQVLGDVAPTDRCRCADEPVAAGAPKQSWLARLRG